MNLKIKIQFEIDEQTLYSAILSCLSLNIKITKNSIIKRIQEEVYQKGISVIHFPEYWGEFENLDSEKEEQAINAKNKYRSIFGLITEEKLKDL